MAYCYKLLDSSNAGSDESLLRAIREVEVIGSPTDLIAITFKDPPAQIEPLTDRNPDWRDLPAGARSKLYISEGKKELSREFRNVVRIAKNDPLQPVRDYFGNYVVTGIGLFLEGWVIFSISNVSTLFKQAYPHCWGTASKKNKVYCNPTWIQSTTYLQLVGILIGQLFFGFMGDWVGRKAAMLTDMTVVLVGLIMLTVSNGTSYQGWVVMYACSQLIFGIGIGGEYPATSTRAVEESETQRELAQRHRGRKVMLAYTMQGWGQFLNLGTLILLLLIFNSKGSAPYSHAAAGATWRVSFGILIPVVIYFLYYRVFVLRELSTLSRNKKQNNVKGYDWQSFGLLITYFWHRLFGTSLLWMMNDWYFYGNGVFRSTFVGIIAGSGASVMTNWLWSFLNAGIQLVGYYAAALSVDFRPWGRKRMTTFSFLMIFGIFLSCYAGYDKLTEKRHIRWFQFLYYFSSFWGLFGSHTTSFLLAAESFPTPVRSTAHGISAASGKVGSIAVTVWFNYASTRSKFLITFPAALIGAICTWVFIADLTGLDLEEQELRWQFIRAGKAKDYHGPAVHPRHLSLWERRVLGIHKQYNPDLHQKQTELIRHSMRQYDKPTRSFSSGKKLDKLDAVPSEPSSEDGQV